MNSVVLRPLLALIALACPASAQNLRQAIIDYQAGRLGTIPATAITAVHNTPRTIVESV